MEENGVDSHEIPAEESIVEAEETNGSETPGEVQTNSVAEGDELHVKKANGRGRGKAKKADIENQAKENNGSESRKRQKKEPTTPLIDRPARDRKSIERFAASIEKEKVKEFKIEKGAGTALKDIPNIVFKLSKRKAQDEIVQLLHKVLYGKRIKAHLAKTNILQFSGYVWSVNEEKEKTKVKERLEKCVKESLLHLSDLLDLNLPKTSSKKEDVVLKLLEFLESPHKTTVKLLEEKEQKSKLKKRKITPVKETKKKTGQTPRKKQKRESKTSKNEAAEEEEEDEAVDVPEEDSEDEVEEEPVKKKQSSKESDDNGYDAKSKISKRSGRKASKKQMEEVEEEDEVETKDSDDEDYGTTSKVLKKKGRKSTKKQVEEAEEDEASQPSSKTPKKKAPQVAKSPVQSPSKETKKSDVDSSKVFSRKKRRAEEQNEEDSKISEKPSKGKGSNRTNAKEENKPKLKIKASFPTDEELREAIRALLQDADFSTVTFTDVVKQLGGKFGVDLSEKKTHVKDLIQEEISKIVEDDGEEEDDDDIDEDAEKVKEEEGSGRC